MFIAFSMIASLGLFLQSSTGLVSQSMTYSEESISSRVFPTLTYAFHSPQVNDFYYLSYNDPSTGNTYNLLSIKYSEGILDNVFSSKFTFAIYEQTNLQYSVAIESGYNSRSYNFDSLYDSHLIYTLSLPNATDFLMTINFVLYSQTAYDNAMGLVDTSTAYQTGYDTGYQNGYTEGNTEGSTTGYDTGYDTGYNDGYSGGYTDGANATQHSFFNLFGAIADTPIMMIRRMFDFSLFGTSMVVVALSLLSFLILLKIVKKVVK